MSNTFVEEHNNLSDNELISQILSGNYEDIQLLIGRYMPLIIKSATNFSHCGVDTEDLIEEGIIAVFSAVKAYDSEKSKFSTFVSLCINRAMMSQLKTASAGKRIPQRLIVPFEEELSSREHDPESIYINKESYERFCNLICSSLSDLEYSVLQKFIAGKSYADIAGELGITVKSVDNSLKRIREKIKNG